MDEHQKLQILISNHPSCGYIRRKDIISITDNKKSKTLAGLVKEMTVQVRNMEALT